MKNWSKLFSSGSSKKEKMEFLFRVQFYKLKLWDLFKKLYPESSEQFAASNGWLWRFCQRHGIRQLSLQGEKLSADRQAAEEFIPKFRKFIEENNYTLSQVFNCDESGLYYKLLPEKSLAAQFEKSADGRKTQKERVTISACSNATGSIKLPLLLIKKSMLFKYSS